MAGRPRSMLKHLDAQVLALAEVDAAILDRMPESYHEGTLESIGEVGTAWRTAIYAVEDAWVAVDRLAEKIAEHNGIERELDPYSTPVDCDFIYRATLARWCQIHDTPVLVALHRVRCGMDCELAVQLKPKVEEVEQVMRL